MCGGLTGLENGICSVNVSLQFRGVDAGYCSHTLRTSNYLLLRIEDWLTEATLMNRLDCTLVVKSGEEELEWKKVEIRS
jgi:hypothetical protein